MSDVEETARDFLSRVRTNDDSGHGVCMDDVDVADLAEKFAVALDTPPKPDTSPVCVEVKELEWQDALPLRRDAIAGGLHYYVRSLTGRVDGPWIAQVTTAVNPYQTADLLSPGPLLEMLKACQADHERRTLELVNARSVESVRAELMSLALGSEADNYAHYDGHVAEWLRTLTGRKG